MDGAVMMVNSGLTQLQTAQLTAQLQAALVDFKGPLAQPCARIVHSPGRRLRPALTLACAAPRDRDPVRPQAMALAAAVELLHCATLVHDDVIDGASTRRGVATINAREGLSTAIVAGDALIAGAMRLAAGVSSRASSVVADTLARLCVGQAAEEALRFDATATTEDVRQVAADKSGSLLRAACLLGAGAAGLDDALTEALGRFGSAFGVGLQMVDDILDLGSTPALLGKPIGADIASGIMTAPIITCLQVQPELRGLLGSAAGSAEHDEALRLILTSGSLEKSIDEARAWARSAGHELATLATDHRGLIDLAGWPARFVDAQLREKLYRRAGDRPDTADTADTARLTNQADLMNQSHLTDQSHPIDQPHVIDRADRIDLAYSGERQREQRTA
jgi:heptaprenyl diphosphate synthase